MKASPDVCGDLSSGSAKAFAAAKSRVLQIMQTESRNSKNAKQRITVILLGKRRQGEEHAQNSAVYSASKSSATSHLQWLSCGVQHSSDSVINVLTKHVSTPQQVDCPFFISPTLFSVCIKVMTYEHVLGNLSK